MAEIKTTKTDFATIAGNVSLWPLPGFFLYGFDTADDLLKKIDEFGVVTQIGSSTTPTLAQVLTAGASVGFSNITAPGGLNYLTLTDGYIYQNFSDGLNTQGYFYIDVSGVQVYWSDSANTGSMNIDTNNSYIQHNLQVTFDSPLTYVNGNLGVGTTSPSGKFNVVHATEGAFELLDNGYLKNLGINGAYVEYDQNSGLLSTDSSTHSRTGFHAHNTAGGPAFIEMVSGGGKSYFNTDSYIEWYANNTGILSARMDSVGKWGFLLDTGIGTLTPSGRLNIVGSTSDSSAYAIKTQDSTLNNLFSVRNDGVSTFTSAIEGDGSGNPMLIVQSTGGGIRHNYVAASTYSTQIQYYDGVDLNVKFFAGNGGVGILYTETYWLAQLSTGFKRLALNPSGDILIGDPANIYAQTARLHVLGSTTDSTAFALKVGDSTSVNLFAVRNDGFVGIGTVTPGALFHVNGDTGMWVSSSTGGYGKVQVIPYSPGQLYSSIVDSDLTELRMSGAFGANAGRWRITNAANNVRLGINKTTAGATLDITSEGNTIATYAVTITNSSAASLFAITDNGNVGIGEGSPTVVFHVKTRGNALATNGFKIFNSDNTNILNFSDSARLTLRSADNATTLTLDPVGSSTACEIITNNANGLKVEVASGEFSLTRPTAGRVLVWTNGHRLDLSAAAGGAPQVTIDLVGNVGIGTQTPSASTILDLTSTTGALLLTRLTTAQKGLLTPLNGMVIYDTDLDKFQGYEAGAWVNLV